MKEGRQSGSPTDFQRANGLRNLMVTPFTDRFWQIWNIIAVEVNHLYIFSVNYWVKVGGGVRGEMEFQSLI